MIMTVIIILSTSGWIFKPEYYKICIKIEQI